jgi:hypothetical protein
MAMIGDIEDEVVGAPMQWFASEYPALISCVQSAYDAGEFSTAWELSCYLAHFFEFRSQWDAWEKTHLIGMNAALELGDEYGEACIRRGLGAMYVYRGLWDAARSHFDLALS